MSRWKNGSGSTRQLLIEPPTATLDNFDYRVSMANVASDGDFSHYAGVDRQLLILEGDGVLLQFSHAPPVLLTPESLPCAFAGETPINCRLPGGTPVLDFNVMTRRGRYQASVQRIECLTQNLLRCTGWCSVFLALHEGIEFSHMHQPFALAQYDLLVLQHGERVELQSLASAHFIALSLNRGQALPAADCLP